MVVWITGIYCNKQYYNFVIIEVIIEWSLTYQRIDEIDLVRNSEKEESFVLCVLYALKYSFSCQLSC